jgi:LysR family transcriptional regulator, transcriptional activator for dmlA
MALRPDESPSTGATGEEPKAAARDKRAAADTARTRSGNVRTTLDDLNELRTFRAILLAGSLSGAARELHVSLPAASKRLASLERRIGQRLIHRTTRRLTPTDEGLELLPYIDRALAELDAAELHLSSGQDDPSGVLRVGCPVSLGRTHLAPVIAQLCAKYPRLQVELQLEDWPVDLLSRRIDVAIYLGRLPDNSYVARKLSDNERILVASPSYLKSRGRPRVAAELRNHACLRWHDGREPWQLEGADGAHLDVEVRSCLRSNNGDVIHQWCLDGLGIMFKSRVDLVNDLAAGRLERILPEWSANAPVCALMPTRRHLTPRIRMFLDALTEHFAGISGS